ncbi:oligomerisation domain protein, partial [Chlamydia psittaci 84-8471/1]
ICLSHPLENSIDWKNFGRMVPLLHPSF